MGRGIGGVAMDGLDLGMMFCAVLVWLVWVSLLWG